MTEERLTWNQIKERYYQEWVVLVDHDWATTNPVPTAGIVKYHCKTKKDRNAFLMRHREELDDVALVYVGEPEAKLKEDTKLITIAEVVTALPRLASVWTSNFPKN